MPQPIIDRARKTATQLLGLHGKETYAEKDNEEDVFSPIFSVSSAAEQATEQKLKHAQEKLENKSQTIAKSQMATRASELSGYSDTTLMEVYIRLVLSQA